MSVFHKGMRVFFETDEGRVFGHVIRVNKKTISVDPGAGDGSYFRVAPDHLFPADEAVPDPLADMLSGMKSAQLRLTQDQMLECLQDDAPEGIDQRINRIRTVIENPAGRLALVSEPKDIETGNLSGWMALCVFLHATKSTLKMAGRLDLQLGGFDHDPRPLYKIPEASKFLAHLQHHLPWIAAWLDAELGAGVQLIGSLSPFPEKGGEPRITKNQLDAAVYIANYAMAFTMKLGGRDYGHVDRFLGMIGIDEVPDGFFAGVHEQAAELDEIGHRVAE